MTFFLFLIWFLIWITPEGFTTCTVVANEGLEKARAYSYLIQFPRDRRLYIPSEGCGVNFRWKHLQTTPTPFWVELSRLLGEKIPVAIVRLEPGTLSLLMERRTANSGPSRTSLEALALGRPIVWSYDLLRCMRTCTLLHSCVLLVTLTTKMWRK